MKKQPKKKTTASKRGLNARQELFCQFVAAGTSQTDAYMKAGFKATKEAARRNAARMLTNADIKKRIKEIQTENPDISIAKMTKQEKLDFLAQVIRTPIGKLEPDSPLCAEYLDETVASNDGKVITTRRKVKCFDKLRAIELHSKLLGHFEPDRKEIEFGNQALMSIKERAKELGYAMSSAYKHGTPAILDD
jgi:hypothetical protein